MSAKDFLPEKMSLEALRDAAATCEGCELYENATQTVFGEGPPDAKIIFVGEQPGDMEDRAGKPFVGPAGQLLDEVLQEVGIDRDDTYVTNAVKHFYFTERGKRRLHKKPSARIINACRPWLDGEMETIKPVGIVCLGATAAQALMGRDFRITKQRGERLESDLANWITATYHPSALLRAPDAEARDNLRAAFREDLQKVKKWIDE